MKIDSVPLSYFAKREDPTFNPMWCINTSEKSVVGQKAEVLISCEPTVNSNLPIVIRVPNTWLPIELTKYATSAQLLSSNHLKKAINLKMVTLISVSTAKKILAQPCAGMELDRVGTNLTGGNSINFPSALSMELLDKPAVPTPAGEIYSLYTGWDSCEDAPSDYRCGRESLVDKINFLTDTEASMVINSRQDYSEEDLMFLSKKIKHSKTLAFIHLLLAAKRRKPWYDRVQKYFTDLWANFKGL